MKPLKWVANESLMSPAGTDDEAEVLQVVRFVREQYSLGCARPPVAIDVAEEHLAVAPCSAEVRFRVAAGDDLVLFPCVIGIVLEPRVEVGVRDERDRPKQRREAKPTAHEPAHLAGAAHRHAAI